MVNFKKLFDRTAEEKAEANRKFDARMAERAAAKLKKIERLCEIADDLSDWEVGFAANVTRQFESDDFLSDTQWGKVDEILEAHGDE